MVGLSLVAACRSMCFQKAAILLMFLLMVSADRFIDENRVCTGFGSRLCKGSISVFLKNCCSFFFTLKFLDLLFIFIRWPSYLTKMTLHKGNMKTFTCLLSLFRCSTSLSPAFTCTDIKTFLMYLLPHKLVKNGSHPRLRADW